MVLRYLACPRCGGPLPPEAERRPVRCPYCRASVLAMPDLVPAERFRAAFAAYDGELRDAGLPGRRVAVDGIPYRLLGMCAKGSTSEVWGGRRDRRISEEVVVKLARRPEGGARLAAEHDVLRRLAASSAPGAGHFGRLVPQVCAFGPPDGDGAVAALVLRRPSGFVHTLDDVAAAHADGLDPRHLVWIWRRLLEVLGFLHASGVSHGAVHAEHVLVHARDHGARLVGFGGAGAAADRTCAADLRDAARAVGALPGPRLPGPLDELLERAAAGDVGSDALDLHRQVGEAARQAYGPPAYLLLAMPGWSRAPKET